MIQCILVPFILHELAYLFWYRDYRAWLTRLKEASAKGKISEYYDENPAELRFSLFMPVLALAYIALLVWLVLQPQTIVEATVLLGLFLLKSLIWRKELAPTWFSLPESVITLALLVVIAYKF